MAKDEKDSKRKASVGGVTLDDDKRYRVDLVKPIELSPGHVIRPGELTYMSGKTARLHADAIGTAVEEEPQG